MAKVTLDDVANLANTTSAQSTINNNSDTIETAFDNTLSRDGSSPNSMAADLDMDSNEILNLAAPGSNASAARLQDVLDQTTEDATSKPATAITIADSGTHFTSDVVEGALQEVGQFKDYFPNVNGTVTATDEQLETISGFTGSSADIESLSGHSSALDTLLNNFDEQRISLGGDFDADQDIIAVRIGNLVTITSDGLLSHSSGSNVGDGSAIIPANFRPTSNVSNIYYHVGNLFRVIVESDGGFSFEYRDFSGTLTSRTNTGTTVSISYVITGNVT